MVTNTPGAPTKASTTSPHLATLKERMKTITKLEEDIGTVKKELADIRNTPILKDYKPTDFVVSRDCLGKHSAIEKWIEDQLANMSAAIKNVDMRVERIEKVVSKIEMLVPGMESLLAYLKDINSQLMAMEKLRLEQAGTVAVGKQTLELKKTELTFADKAKQYGAIAGKYALLTAIVTFMVKIWPDVVELLKCIGHLF